MSLEDWTETFVLASRTSAASQTSHSTVLATSDRCALNANDQRGPAGLRRADDRFHFGRTQQAEPSATFAVLNSSPRSGRSNPDRRPCGACSGGRKPVGGTQASLAQRSDVARPTEARNHVLALRATVPCSVFCGSPWRVKCGQKVRRLTQGKCLQTSQASYPSAYPALVSLVLCPE